MFTQRMSALVGGSLLSFTFACGTAAAIDYKIVTADPKGTYYAIGQDLAKYVAPDAGIELEVLPTDGSAANIKHLRYDPGVKLAIVQADVYQAFLDRAAGGNREAAAMIGPLRVILPLYNTEIHFVARANSPMNYLHDMRDAKINGGLVGSGAAFITHTLYRMMFGKPIPEAERQLPLECRRAREVDLRRKRRCRRRSRRSAGPAHREHASGSTEVYQAPQVRSDASFSEASADRSIRSPW